MSSVSIAGAILEALEKKSTEEKSPTIASNRRRERTERRRQEALAQLAQAGDGAVSRSFPELVSGRRWRARVGLSGVQSLEPRSLDLETACAVLELVRGES